MRGSRLSNKIVLITGGTGSFGREFTKLLLKECNPRAIRIYSRGEHRQLQMQVQFNDPRLRFLIGDVRDKNRLSRSMNDVDVVVHAAALKSVPTVEYNPIEAVRTNIEGTMNLIDAAIENGVKRVLALSTDKAVYPVNLYGATKLVAEKLLIQGNSYTGQRNTRFSCVRYGNVINSQGSVIPIFIKQKESGALTITDARMTRFWITLEKSARFVLECVERMKGGEVFIPKIPSAKVIDIAEAIAPSAKKTIVGIRPGEKINETLITAEESLRAKEYEDFFVIEPEFAFWSTTNLSGGRPVPDGFRYSSDTNTQWFTKSRLRRIMKENLRADNPE